MTVYYIGAFPPVYGGVTIKNQNLCGALEKELELRKVDMNRVKRGNLKELLRLARAFLCGKQFVIGLAGQRNRRIFTKLMRIFKRKAMARSVLMVMGGSVEDMLSEAKWFNGYRRIYVELPGMAAKLAGAGITNGAIYPNGRPRPEALPEVTVHQAPLQCVFFSIVRPEKGTDLILDAAKQLPHMEFHFYGPVQKDYETDFFSSVEECANVTYHGVFTGDAEAVYRQLGAYDLLLLPTRWKGEGLPGILIEAKIAGLASVVTDHHYNREIVCDGVDGVVLAEHSADALVCTLEDFHLDRDKLLAMKRAARESAQKYYIDVCARQVRKDLERG